MLEAFGCQQSKLSLETQADLTLLFALWISGLIPSAKLGTWDCSETG